jgi:hypothetical protein
MPTEQEKVQFETGYKALADQCKNEYEVAWKHQKDKKDEWELRLQLYNNQKRDKSAVGDTTLFTIMQTVLASLYVDKLNAEFNGREEGDEETAENLTAMAEFDYDEMGKAQLDYDWDWDTCFFGRGLMAMEEYDRDPANNVFVPQPQVLDPLLFLRDPNAKSVNGDSRGRGAMRFGGYEMKMTKQEMLDHPSFFKGKIKFDEISYEGGDKSILKDANEARDEAQGREYAGLDREEELGDNSQYDVTVWYTQYKDSGDNKPEKYKVFLTNDRSNVVGLEKIKRTKGKRVIWSIVDRPLYPTSHDWDGVSIPDLVEDKQRARAVAQNLGLKAMKADIYPMYVYDSNRIRNRNDLNFDFNKFVPADIVEGGSVAGAIQPINKASPNMNLLDFIYTSLDVSAQKATATPEIQQGAMSEEQRTLGELNLISSKVDTRYSLSAKIFGWSEAEFWYHWYAMYDENFASDIDEKILRIVGAFGARWRPLSRKDIVAKISPDIKIESRVLSRAKQLEEREMMVQYISLVAGDPTANVRYGLKELGRLSGWTKDRIDRLLPPTIDERIAEDQNELLNQDKVVPVLPEDDHNVHLEIHMKAKETDATYAHIETHKKALSIKKVHPEMFPMDATAANFQSGQAPVKPIATPTAIGTSPIKPSQTSGQM